MKNCYINFVDGKKFGKLLEDHFLQWQVKNGRSTVQKFADFLGIGRPYLTMLMNGKRTSVSYPTALMISERLDDYTLLDLLGYARPTPKEITYDQLPPTYAIALKESMNEINTLVAAGLDPHTPQGEQTIIQTFEKHGITYQPPKKKP